MEKIRTILLAEDDLFQQKLVKSLLERKLGVTVLTANNGSQAQTILKLNKIDAIVTDLAMPDCDGVTFLHDYFIAHKTAVPVAIISSSPTEVMNSAKSMAPNALQSYVKVFSKPISAEKIIQMSDWLLSANKTPAKPLDTGTCLLPNLSYASLKEAIKNGQFIPFFQGQFSKDGYSLSSVEALVRWRHPVLGDLAPNDFLEAIYDRGLGVELSISMFEAVVRRLTKWRHIDPNIGVSINLTQSDLCDERILTHIERIMRLYRLPSDQLTIEVTESESAPRKSQFLKATTRLRLQGVNLAIDDFGTGFSSLTNLIDGPYNEIKIDTSYVKRMMTCKRCLAAVENVVALGQKLEMTIVAEGVETQEQAQLLVELGCNKLQGYWLSKPMDSGAFEALFLEKKVAPLMSSKR